MSYAGLPFEPSDWQVVLASPTRAVVLGDEGRAGWSDDGANWHFVTLPGNGATPAAGVWAADRGEFLAVGRDADASAFRVWRSTDGINWGSRKVYGPQVDAPHPPVGLARGAGKYVVALAEGWILHSEDGIDWQYGRIGGEGGFLSQIAPEGLQGMAYDGHTFKHLAPFQNRLLGVGDNGLIVRSGPWSDFYENWRLTRFSAGQLADPAISGDDRDPDGDGLANLLEYALGLDPLAPDAAAAVRFSRMLSQATGDAAAHVLRLEFPSWDGSPGVRVWAEHSTDLRNWSRAGWRAGQAYDANGTVRTINGREVWTREIDASGPQGFLRLRGGRITGD